MMKEKLTANILFSGIGCQERGILNTKLFDLDVISTSDIDKDAIVSYATIHCGLTKDLVENYSKYPTREEMVKDLQRLHIGYIPEKNKEYDWEKVAKKKTKQIEKYWLACKLSHQLGDISNIEQLPYADFWSISFPCQSISVAGKMKGLAPDSGTRSSLLWENIRLLKDSVDREEAPKYLMFENVKNLVSKKFIDDFNVLLEIIDKLGYNTYWKVLNASACGVPQNRQRVFCIGIRKDIDTKKFSFPIPFDNGLRLKDILEDSVEEKYFINTDRAKDLIRQLVEKGQLKGQRECCDSTINDPNIRQISNCITARYDASIQNQKQIGLAVAEPKTNRVGGMYDDEKGKHQAGSVYNINGVCATLDTAAGRYRMPSIIEEINNYTTIGEGHVPMVGFDNKPIQVGNTTSSSKSQCNAVYSTEGISQTISPGTHGYSTDSIVDNYRIRKLTPKETFALMGLTKEDAQKCMDVGQSNSALYKQSGNGIVTNCVELIFEHLYKAQYDEKFICKDENFINPQVN